MKKGFTLVELLVVVTILSVLGMGGLAIFSDSSQNASDQTRSQQMGNLKQALDLYRAKYQSYPKNLVELTPAYLDQVPVDPKGRAYQYLALPNPGCTSAAHSCVSFVICAKKDGNRSFETPAECQSLNCSSAVGDCDMGVKE